MKVKTKFLGEVDWEKYQEYLVKSIYKTLPLMEEKRDWKRYLAGLLFEIGGMEGLLNTEGSTLETEKLGFLSAKLNKLFSLTKDEIDSGEFRRIVFNSIDLVKKIKIKE